MAFVDRRVIGAEPPAKTYVHQAGLSEAYGDLEMAYRHMAEVMAKCRDLLGLDDFRYLITAVWGDGPDEVVDIFGYSGIDDRNWHASNPDVSGWVARNGIMVPSKCPREADLTCGDTLIVLGREEELRRTIEHLDEYIQTWPDLSNIPTVWKPL